MTQRKRKVTTHLDAILCDIAQSIADSEGIKRSAVLRLLIIEALKARGVLASGWDTVETRGGDRMGGKVKKSKQ